MARNHKGYNPRVVILRAGDGVELRLPPCERYQVLFDTANVLDTLTLQYRYTGALSNAFTTIAGPGISAILVYPGPDTFLHMAGPANTRAWILLSGNQLQGEFE